MTGLLVLELDRDTAGHLAVALRRHRGQLERSGLVEPPGLAELETIALGVAKRHDESRGVSALGGRDDELDARDFLTRGDVCRRTGASLSTVDRWIGSGQLPSSKHGRIRRVGRGDLERFLAAA